MIKNIIAIALAASLLVLTTPLACAADAEKINTTFEELKTETQEKGLPPEDINAASKSIKNMIGKGASKGELKRVLTDFSNKGLKGKDFKNLVEAVNELVNNGETVKEAGNIVSRTVHQAQAQGLKGKDLAAKVHEAVRQRKTEREQAKTQLKVQKQVVERKIKVEKTKKEAEKAIKGPPVKGVTKGLKNK